MSANLSDFERALAAVAGERAAETLLAEFRPVWLALLTEHAAVTALWVASRDREPRLAREWFAVVESHVVADQQLAELRARLEMQP